METKNKAGEAEHTNNNIDAPAKGLGGADAQATILPERQWAQAGRTGLVILTLVLVDIVLAFLVWRVALIPHGFFGRGELSDIAVASIVPSVGVWVGLRAILGLYPGYGLNAVEELRRQTYSVAAALAATAIFALAFQVGDLLSRLLLGFSFLILLLVNPLMRYLTKWGMMKYGIWGKPVAILGVGETGAQLVQTLRREWGLGLKPGAVFNFRPAPRGGVLEGVHYGGTVNDALDLTQTRGMDTVIFAMPHIRREYLTRFVDAAGLSFRHVIVIPNLLGVTNSAVVSRDLAGVFGVEIKHNLLNPWALRAKRALELGVTIVGGTLLLPLLLAISLLIWLDSRGQVIYRAERVGRNGETFWCIKFRTMVPDAENALQRVLAEDADQREQFSKYHKLRDDPRVTRIGRFLRKSSLDELPQLWNVLRGEMNLIGPRPIQKMEIPKYGKAYEIYKQVTPGLSGLWQVSGRSNTSYEERVALDTYYVRNWSVWLDLIIMARTVTATMRDFRSGAY